MSSKPSNSAGNTQPTAAELRRQRLREEMREEILGAARDLLHEQGATALTMRAVAERIGYSTGALYEYFSSKDELCSALFFQGSKGLAGRLRSALGDLPDGADLFDRLEATGRAYRAFAKEYRDLYLLIFSQQAPVDRDKPRSAFEEDQAYSTLLHLVAEGIALGELRPVDPMDGALLLWSWIHGFVMLELTGHIPQDPPGVAERLFDQGRMLVVSGLISWGG